MDAPTLYAYIDAKLDGENASAKFPHVKAHLDKCVLCRRKAQKQSQYSYLDDKEEWIKAKRQLRSRIERTFAQLKCHFGLNNLRIRGLTQVAQYILSRCMAYIACVIVAHRIGRPDLKASPKRLLWSS